MQQYNIFGKKIPKGVNFSAYSKKPLKSVNFN